MQNIHDEIKMMKAWEDGRCSRPHEIAMTRPDGGKDYVYLRCIKKEGHFGEHTGLAWWGLVRWQDGQQA